MMRLCLQVTIAFVLPSCHVVRAADLGAGWQVVRGEWGTEREVVEMLRQADPAGVNIAVTREIRGAAGAWRACVEPSIGTAEAGLLVQGDGDLKTGFLATLGGTPGVGGFALKSADGRVLWEDRWAPWHAYWAYVVEGVVEPGKVRAQLFEADGATLISQSPWVEVEEALTRRPGALGLYTSDGIARFWRAERAAEPLSPIVPDAPNKRRLVQDNSPWTIVGPGNWMWTTGRKERLQQYASVERTTAIHRGTKGALRKWECRVKVFPGAGGSGMLFQTNEKADRGFMAWLGGAYGAGSLMLYELPLQARWSGKQDNWHYDTEYLIRAETRKGQARVQLLAADGETMIQDSSWINVSEGSAEREGCLGLQTWKGTAQFWGFSEATKTAAPTPLDTTAVTQLGAGWQTHGGAWSWSGADRKQLRQRDKSPQAIALCSELPGALGTWRCHVKASAGAKAAGLVFQASRDLKQGFACLLSKPGVRLENLEGKTLWEDPTCKWSPGTKYVIEGKVVTDRVALRLLSAEGKTVIVESPEVYVPDTNNQRNGSLGLITRGGPAEFSNWGLE